MSDTYSKRRVIAASITTVVSLSLVLFMLGLLGMVVLNTSKLSEKVKENISFQIILNDNAKEMDVAKLQKTLDASDFVRSTEFVNKDEAAKRLKEDLGEDFVDFLGYNPLLSSINVHLKADYANTDSIGWIEKELLSTKLVKEVIYHKSSIDAVNDNAKKIGVVILAFSVLLMLVALALINNTIRLTIYSKRFIIKTMQLVGATQGFIRRPFLFTGIRHGFVSAMFAIGMLIGVLYAAQSHLPELVEVQDETMIATLFGAVILIGIIISLVSTYLAVGKYLRLKTDDLYY